MKQLSVEEKAKRYDEAIEIIKSKWHYKNQSCFIDVAKIFPELVESEDERMIQYFKDLVPFDKADELYEKYGFSHKDAIAWLEKQGEFKSSKWTEGDVVKHGGILALVTNGRKAMKSNCEQITVKYPDEWVKAETKERKYFFEELEKQASQRARTTT